MDTNLLKEFAGLIVLGVCLFGLVGWTGYALWHDSGRAHCAKCGVVFRLPKAPTFRALLLGRELYPMCEPCKNANRVLNTDRTWPIVPPAFPKSANAERDGGSKHRAQFGCN